MDSKPGLNRHRRRGSLDQENDPFGGRSVHRCCDVIVRSGFLLCFLAFGCGNKQIHLTLRRPPPEQWLVTALKSSDPDVRREAVAKVIESEILTDGLTVSTLKLVATTDESALTRATAVHGLGLVHREEVIDALIDTIDDPDPRVRAEACWAITQCRNDLPTLKQAETVRDVLINHLRDDRNVDVKIHAATALGYFQEDRLCLRELILALAEDDFAVRYHAEASLIRLTGKTFNGDSEAWLDWMEKTTDPFKDAGKVPDPLARKAAARKKRWWKSPKELFKRWRENP